MSEMASLRKYYNVKKLIWPNPLYLVPGRRYWKTRPYAYFIIYIYTYYIINHLKHCIILESSHPERERQVQGSPVVKFEDNEIEWSNRPNESMLLSSTCSISSSDLFSLSSMGEQWYLPMYEITKKCLENNRNVHYEECEMLP